MNLFVRVLCADADVTIGELLKFMSLLSSFFLIFYELLVDDEAATLVAFNSSCPWPGLYTGFPVSRL